MREAGFILALLALTAAPVWAQQELPQSTDGPLNIKAGDLRPDKDGVYAAGPGIVMPIVIERAAAVYPADVPDEAVGGLTTLSIVVGVDGQASEIEVVASHGAAYDTAAMEAVRQSKFDPGTLDGKAVPVRVFARVRFFANKRAAYPRVSARPTPAEGMGLPYPAERGMGREFDKAPVLTHSVEAVYSEKARRARLNGVVLISLLVSEQGLPRDVKVVRSLGMGLDENAVDCVRRYTFLPATKDGEPVAAHIIVEVSFRTY